MTPVCGTNEPRDWLQEPWERGQRREAHSTSLIPSLKNSFLQHAKREKYISCIVETGIKSASHCKCNRTAGDSLYCSAHTHECVLYRYSGVFYDIVCSCSIGVGSRP